jgi:hypothetical protein
VRPKRKRDPDGTEYVFSPSANRYIACETAPEVPEVVAKRERRETRKNEAFAQIPLWWARRANEDCGEYEPPNILVCAELVHRAFKNGESFVMPKVPGVGKKVKLRSLRALEAAGLIEVEWRRGQSPLITCPELRPERHP